MASFPLRRFGPHAFLIASACMYYLVNTPILLGHYDLGWHLAAGDLIRERGSVPLHDSWSYTAGDARWFNVSWLWDVIASFVFQWLDFSGLILLVVGCGAVLVGYLTSVCLRCGGSTIAVCISVFLASILYPAYATYPNIYLSVSPNMATMLFAVVFYGECLRRTRWFLLPAIMLAWANMHGGFLLGFFIIGVFGLVALLGRDWPGVKIYLAAGLGCAVAALINPLGWHIHEGITITLGHFSQTFITEWWPYHRNVSWPGSIPGMIYIAVFVVLEIRERSLPTTPPRLLSWFFLILGLYQYRYMSFFFLFSTVPLALHLDRLLPGRLDNDEVRKALLVAGCVTACALPVIFMQARPAFGLPQLISRQDIDFLKTNFSQARLLNHWNFGGVLIFHDRGAIPVFVDGRSSTAYPDPLLRDYFKLGQQEVKDSDWDDVLGKYSIDTVLWVKAHDELRQFLVGRRGWREVYTGDNVSIYTRPR